jgi:predicted NBD/HSP70 family sugar kinase
MGPEQARHAALLVEAILRNGPQSRSELVEQTGLSRAIVADRIADLVARGILAPDGTLESSRGRRPGANALSPEHGHVLTAVGGFSHIRVAIFDTAQRILAEEVADYDLDRAPDEVMAQIEAIYARLLPGIPRVPPLRGVCIGLPTPVEYPHGVLVAPPDLPHWDGFAVSDHFESRLGVPCWTDNEVNLMAVGEHLARGGRPDDMIMVKIGRGIGAGIISDGRLHRGAHGSAGDIGHNRVPGSAVTCVCGRVGCLGTTAGTGAWIRRGWDVRTGRRLPGQPADGTWEALLRASGTAIGEALAGLVNFFDPALIVFGGTVVPGTDLLMATIREAVYANALPLATRHLALERSIAGEGSGVAGAAFTALAGIYQASRLVVAA